MDVAFESHGSTLRGVFHLPPPSGPGTCDWGEAKFPALACLHGLTLDHSFFEDLGKRLAAEGVALLRFNARGHGDSGGKLEEQGFEDEVDDLLEALTWLGAHPEVDRGRLGVLGFSLGGAVACVASARRAAKGKPLKALATWGSLLDTSAWKNLREEQYGRIEGKIVRIWDDIPVATRLFEEAIAVNPYADGLAFPGPYFAAHALRDKAHPPAKSQELVAARLAAGLPAEGFFPPDSGHKFQKPEDFAELNARTAAFFKKNL